MAEVNKPQVDEVTVPNSKWAGMNQEWRMIEALLGGTKAMRLARDEYLPRYEGEDQKAYEFRLKNTYLYNYYKKAIQALVGKPFSQPITHPEDEPEEMKPIANDFDLQGNDITIYAKNWFTCAMSYGHSYTLVDYPDTGGAQYTRLDEKANNMRPYAVHIPAKDVIGWRVIDHNGSYKLQQVRIRQTSNKPVGQFGEQESVVVRVYDWNKATGVVSWTLWEDMGVAGWVATKSGNLKGVDEIPLVCIYTGQTGVMTSEPPLLDLAYLNVAHWQSTSDMRHIMSIQACPVLFARGFGKDKLPNTVQIGPNRMLVAANPEANLSYVEHTGVAITKFEEYIDKLEDQMAALAIKLLAEKRPGGVTATEVSVDSAAAESSLKSMVTALQDALEHVIYFMSLWMGKRLADDQIPAYKINRDFGMMTGNDMIANWLLKANAQGVISKQTVGEGAKKIGYLDEELDMDEELEKAQEESANDFEAMNAALGGSPPLGGTPSGQDDPNDPAEDDNLNGNQ